MSLILIIALAALFIFLLGVLGGSGLVTRTQDNRDRRQAAVQRDLNQWSHELRQMAERQAAKEEELRWRYLEQAGLTVINHDHSTEVATQTHLSRPARRPAR